jgi:hypothetical protein
MKRYQITLFPFLLTLAFLSCGKKGPLEPPVIRIPKDIEIHALRQRGKNLYLQWINPTHYVDGNPIRELFEIEIWILEREKDSEDPEEPVTEKNFRKEGKLLRVIPNESFSEHLIQTNTEASVLQVVLPLDENFLRKKYYISFRAVDTRKRKSDYTDPAVLVPAVLPFPPVNLQAEVFEDKVVIRWDPPEKNIDQSVPPRVAGYNLFRSQEGRIIRLNSGLVSNREYEDSDFVFETAYVYRVRAVASPTEPVLESEDSESLTVVPKDTFPPAPPRGLVAIAGSDVLSLSWETNSESDLRGYRVWRKAEQESNFAVITPNPILENSFTDVSVEKNKRYYYAITALDEMDNESRMSSVISEILREGQP